MDKLSELSKPVAEVVSKFGDPEAFGEREIKLLTGIQQMAYGTKFYSQEYVSALDKVAQFWIGESAGWKKRAEDAEKRIAELERANQSQGDHINQQQDRIESLEKKNGDLGQGLQAAEKRISGLVAKLATPVRLPTQEKYDDPLSAHLAINDSADAIRAAGFNVMGDEQC